MSEERRQGATSAPVPADLLVLGGIVVTMDERRTILPRGGLAIRDGRIVAVGPRDDIARAHAAPEVIDADEDLVIPGLVDGHTHIAMTLFRGLADDLPLHVWLERHVWPAERRFIHPDTVRLGSRLGVAELLTSGVTTLCDMYFFEDDVAAIVDELGMRGVLGQAFFDGVGTQGLTRDETIAYAKRFVDRWRGHPRIVPALAPHAPYTVTPELYRTLRGLAETLDVPITRTWRRPGTRTARSGRATAARRCGTWSSSACWARGSSPRTACGWTPRRSTSWPRAVRASCTTRAAT